MSIAYLGLGSNVEPKRHLRAGIEMLQDHFLDVTCSPVYRSASVGFDGRDFLNLVVRVCTDQPPLQVKATLNDIEDRHGRRRNVPKFSDRTLDIDLLLYDDRVLDHADLVLPRREILKYAHVLRPLADLAPDLCHPGSEDTYSDLWKRHRADMATLEPAEL